MTSLLASDFGVCKTKSQAMSTKLRLMTRHELQCEILSTLTHTSCGIASTGIFLPTTSAPVTFTAHLHFLLQSAMPTQSKGVVSRVCNIVLCVYCSHPPCPFSINKAGRNPTPSWLNTRSVRRYRYESRLDVSPQSWQRRRVFNVQQLGTQFSRLSSSSRPE